LVAKGGQEEIDAIVVTIMHRHLDRHQKMEAWRLVQNLSNKPLSNQLIVKILDAKGDLVAE